MTASTELCIQEAFNNKEKFAQAKTQIAHDISSGKYDISQFVESLGFALTSTVVDERANGTLLLSEVLSVLPPDFLSAAQLEFLTTFYTDRLKDNHNVIPAVIDGIHALVLMKHMPHKSVPKLLHSFFQHTTCQSQVRSDRTKVFSILKYASENYATELRAMSGDFIYGLINSIDGERDPRNLDFIFSFMAKVIASYPLLHLSEEMFEVFACYFPIDFNPSKNDPDTITRDFLAKKLTNCLVATTEFIDWTIPLALEKLESDLIVAKLDSLELLSQSALHFPSKSLEPHFVQIWSAIKREIFPGTDNKDIVSTGLKALRILLEQAAPTPEISHNYQTHVLGAILPHLSDVHQRLFEPSSAIALVCISGDAHFASEKILNCFLIKLKSIEDQNDTQNNEQRMKIYNTIAKAFQILSHRNAVDKVDTNILSQIQENAIACLRCESESVEQKEETLELKVAALDMLNQCVPVIGEINRVRLYTALMQLINDDKIDLDLTTLLTELGSLHPVELQSNCIDACIRNFPIFSNFVKYKIYKNLSPLVIQMSFTQRVLDLIMSNIFQRDNQTIVNDDGLLLALEALNTLLRTEDKKFVEELQSNSCLVDKLIKLAQKEKFSMNVLEELAVALSLVMQKLAISEQYMIVTEYLSSLNLQSQTDLFVARGLLGHLHEDISLDDHYECLLDNLRRMSLECDDARLRTVAHHLLCNIVNKINYNDQNRTLTEKAIEEFKTEIKSDNAKAVEGLAWLAKGLIARGSDESSAIIESLVELIEHPTLAHVAAFAFEIISAEYSNLHLSVVKFLYKQKLFHMVLAKLGHKLESYSEHHLNAFMYVLKSIPHTVLKMNIEKVGPILFSSLESKQKETLCISLEICENFIKHQDEYFRNHLDRVIPNCIALTEFREPMKVRISALNVLYDITNYPTSVVLSHKTNVVLKLVPALDDPKRLVRMAAVRARNAWFLVGI